MGDCVRRAIQLGTAVGRRMHRWESKSSKDAHYASFGSFLLSARTRISFILRLVGYASSALTDNTHSGCPGSLSHIRVCFRWLKKGGETVPCLLVALTTTTHWHRLWISKTSLDKGWRGVPWHTPGPLFPYPNLLLAIHSADRRLPSLAHPLGCFFLLVSLSLSLVCELSSAHSSRPHSPLPKTHSLP